ncbi:MAG: translocation/assembly module TamB domain-containing protein [Candidatus Latescibacteria bacterium]|nr:translocation/assembly module TamB domain-containing protein [Candidatus Latescibacterota bacterium]
MRKQISEFLTQKSTELISKSVNIDITAEAIEGNILRGIELSGVEIILPSGDSVHADKVQIEYDILSVIRQRSNKIHQLKIIRPVINLIAKPERPVRSSDINLNFTFPLLLINRLEIIDGCLLSGGAIMIDTFSLLANLNFRTNRAWLQIRKLSCLLPIFGGQVQNIQGLIDVHNNIIKMSDFKINSNLASADFDAKVDLAKRIIDLKTKKADVLLKAVDKNNDGKVILDGSLSVSFLKSDWIISEVKSDFSYQTQNLTIQKNLIPDGNGKIIIKDSIVALDFRSLMNDSVGDSDIKLISNIYFNPISYRGQLSFTNLPISLTKDKINYLNGIADFKGFSTDSIDINIFAASTSPQIDSISAQAKLRQGKIILEQLRIKEKTNILNATGYGRFAAKRTEFDINLNFTDFSLKFLSEVINELGLSEISMAGVLNGNLNISHNGSMVASRGMINVKDGNYTDWQVNQLLLEHDIENLSRLAGKIKISADSIVWSDNKFEHFDIVIDNNNLFIEIENWQDKSLVAEGMLAVNGETIECLIDSLQIIGLEHTFNNTKTFRIGKTDSHLYLKDLSLVFGTGTLSIDIVKEYDLQLKIELSAQEIDLYDISDFMKFDYAMNGIINLNIRSSELNSSVDIELSGYNITVPMALLNSNNHRFNNQAPITLKSIRGDFALRESVFTINKIDLIRDIDTSKIHGSIHLNGQPIEQLPLDIDITFADPGAWLFFFLKQTIDLREGKIYGQGRVKGSLQAPDLSGEVLITDGNLYLVPTKTPCQDVMARLTFSKLNINIEELQGKVGPGSISAQGFVKLLEFTKVDTLSIQVVFKDAPFRPDKDIFAIASGNINIDLREDNNIREKTPLSLAGDIRIKEALITTEFETSTSVSNGEEEDISFNLKITGERDIWLRNRMCDIELNADLNVFSQDKNNVYSGAFTAIQGNFYYFDHTLKLTKGLLTFDNISEFNPELDISAELTTRQIEVQPGQFERMKIILALTGRLKEPIFVFSSDPPYLTQNDIISYLTFNVTWQEMTASESRELFTSALSGKLIGYFERELTKRIRNLIYLDYLWIESGLMSGNGAKVTVGKYISPKLYFTYEYDITGNVYDIFRIEYYLTKSHEVIGEHDKDGRYKLKYQYKIRY